MKQLQEKNLDKLQHIDQVRLALFCAKQVEHLVKPEHKEACDKAVETVEAWLIGKATSEECMEAGKAAYAITYAANAAYVAANAAYAAAAAYTAYAAVNAAYYAVYHTIKASTNKEQTIKEQWIYYNELLHFDEIVERELLTDSNII